MSDNKENKKIEEALNLSSLVLRTAIQIASQFAIEENLESKVNISAALSLLAIAASSPPSESSRIINIARKLANLS